MAIANEVQQQVYDLLSRSSNLSFVTAEPATGGVQALSLSPGQRVMAEVMGQVQAGRVPVRIGAQQLNLELPIQVRQGQNLELTFVGSDPRPTFAMARPGVPAPPVSLTDASRLLSLLVSNEDLLGDPRLRSSLQSIGDLLRRSSGDTSVLANFLDDFLTYRQDGRATVVATGQVPNQPGQQVGGEPGQPPASSTGLTGRPATPFEETASKLLLNLAQRARFTLVDVANQPLHPLPLKPGDEAAALVQGHLPGGRVLVQLAGESLELQLALPVQQGELLRLALVSQQPKLVFALLGQPAADQAAVVSDAARWLSSMVRSETGQTETQQAVLSRLQQVLTSLPPGSPALAAIMDEAMIYGATPFLTSRALQGQPPGRPPGSDDDVLKLLQALMQGNRMALLEPQLTAPQVLSFQPGQQLKGEVLQSLGGGRFMIQVAGQNMEVLLPKGIRAGDGLNLFFVGNDPPAFLLVRHGKGGDALVSETGRWVSTLLGMQNQSVPLQEGLGILKTLLQAAPSDPAQLEQQLAKGLRESGLFYESHVARWFSGDYPLEGLLKEPQGRLSAQLQPPPLAMLPRDATAEQLEAALKQRAALVSEGNADPRTMPIIKEQLATLQTGQLLFQGELFPGQPMEWRVAEREAGGQQEHDNQEVPWETSLSLALPGLGMVDASLTLTGNQVNVRLQVGPSATAHLLDEGKNELVDQLAAAGLDTQAIEIRHGKQPTQ